jgi:Kef-type K+ transport system membrane component KefB
MLTDLLADLALVLVACGLVLLIPMSNETSTTTGVVLALTSVPIEAVAMVRLYRRRRR